MHDLAAVDDHHQRARQGEGSHLLLDQRVDAPLEARPVPRRGYA
jgi:hypothetical protein